MSAIFGPLHFFVIQITMMAVAGSCGIWLFYVQHQFEDTYWAQSSEWDFTSAAMEGVAITGFQKSCNGFQATLDFITFII